MTGHRFSADHSKRLSDESRRKVQPAEDIVQRMSPRPSETVADLGCGTGYITLPLAARVTKVYAIDAQQAMLDRLAEHVPEGVGERIVTILAELPLLPLADASIDRAVLVNVVHEVDDLPLLHSELRRCMRAGGMLSIVDFPRRETSFGPPLEERLSEEQVLEAFPSFQKVKVWSFSEFYQLELQQRP